MNRIVFHQMLFLVLVGLLILTGCVQQAAVPGMGGEVTTTPTQLPPTPTPLPPVNSPAPTTVGADSGTPAPETISVTPMDYGKTIELQVGQAFLLNLGEGYDWTVTIADQSIISREIGVMTIRGSQGLFMAHKPGKTTLDATGNPPCLQSKPPCLMPSRIFQVTIVVK